MLPMSRDWTRLGSTLSADRKAAGIRQEDMARRVGVGRSTIQSIDRGQSKKVTPTIRAYAQELGWTPESIEDVLGGGSPTVVDAKSAAERQTPTTHADTPPTDENSPFTDLPLRVVQAMTEGNLLDTRVIELPGSNGGRMSVIVRGDSDATPEQIKADLEAWLRAERHLQNLDDEDDPPEPQANEA